MGKRKRRAGLVSSVWVLLVFVAAFGVVLNVPAVRASGTIYIRADGSIDPPTAPIQRDGNLYTFTDNIYEPIVVERNDIIIDGKGFSLEALEYFYCGFYLSGTSNVTICNTKITAFNYGVYVVSYDSHAYIYNITISNNTISAKERGIYLAAAAYSTYESYVYIYNVNISNNTILSQGYGIYLYANANSRYEWHCKSYAYIYDIIVSNNTVASELRGIYLEARHIYSGYGYSHIYNVTVSSNNVTVSSAPSSYLREGIALDSYGVYAYYVYAYVYNVIISNNTVAAQRNSVRLTATAWGHGSGSSDAYIYNITIANNALSAQESGIRLHALSGPGPTVVYDVVICNNTIKARASGVSMYIYAATVGHIYDVLIFNNVVSRSTNGIFVYASGYEPMMPFDVMILNNTLSANNVGLYVFRVKTSATFNSISYNLQGVLYDRTTSNLAHYNDIYRNSYGMNVTDGAAVNAAYNYWGDTSGPYHESLNPDGKGNSVNGDGTDLNFIPFITNPIGQINERPLAILLADKTTVPINQTVTFDASGSTDDGLIEYYFFDFGDGTNSSWITLPRVEHKYASGGTYNATLIVMDNLGVTSLDGDLAYVTITVLEPPQANFTYSPELPLVDVLVTFNASTSYDPDGTIVSYLWDFGDGNTTTVPDPIIRHAYAAEGVYLVNLTVTDNDGLSHSLTKSITVGMDSTPPTTLDNYDGLWHTSDFTITLTATDDMSGVAETYYKINDGPTKTVSVDGQPRITTEGADNKLEYWSVDNAGNEESHHILTGIKLDKTAPTGSITINNDATYSTSTSVALTLTSSDATSGVYQVRFSNDGVWDTESWETPTSTKTWTLTSGDGTKTVYYQVKDIAGLVSITYSDTIILDTTSPTGSITINDGATYTTTPTVTLTLSATDATSGIAEMRFSNDNVTWSDWEPYATSKSWTLITGDGLKGVTAQYKDNAGLISSYSDSIILDTTKPTANAGQDQTVNVGATVSFDAGASTDNVGIVSYEWDFGDGTTAAGKTTTHTYASPGTYTVTLTVKDVAGNTATHQITITVLSAETFPLWIVGAVVAVIALATAAATLILWKRRK